MKKAGVIGWPVSHSRSPLIHRYWLDAHGLEGSYERFPLPPEEADAAFAAFKESGLVGANVTIPHKETVVKHLDHAEASVRRLGAANTLWLEGGKLCGDNTDGYGFLANLDAAAPGWDAVDRPAFVLGAGGAARAVVDALAGRGFHVFIVNRTLSRAEELAAHHPGKASAHALEAASHLVSEARLVVNTSALGMKGAREASEEDLPIDLAGVRSDALVTDIVYVPLETPLLAAARRYGLRTIDGLGMLLHQAVPGFARWFGVRPAVTAALRARIEADLHA